MFSIIITKKLDKTKKISYIIKMKVTAMIPDNLVNEVKQYNSGKNLSESLVVVLEEWVSLKKIKSLNEQISNEPFEFINDFSSNNIRSKNRNR